MPVIFFYHITSPSILFVWNMMALSVFILFDIFEFSFEEGIHWGYSQGHQGGNLTGGIRRVGTHQEGFPSFLN